MTFVEDDLFIGFAQGFVFIVTWGNYTCSDRNTLSICDIDNY